MRTKDNTLDLANIDFNRFKTNMKHAIEYFSGSPVKKEAKVFEACAIALGDENSDRLAATLRRTVQETASALILTREGICPFSKTPLDSEISWRLGAKYFIDHAKNQLVIESFPAGMTLAKRMAWVSSQPMGEVRVAEESVVAPQVIGEPPHLHAAIAGYREHLEPWFMCSEEAPAYTLCYWHSSTPAFSALPLAKRLKYETHYELVLGLSEGGKRQEVRLYRIFNIGTGDNWQLSQDATIGVDFPRVHMDGFRPVINRDLKAYLDLIIWQGICRPAKWIDEGVDHKSQGFIDLIDREVKRHLEDAAMGDDTHCSDEQKRHMVRNAFHQKGYALHMINAIRSTLDCPFMVANRMSEPAIHILD